MHTIYASGQNEDWLFPKWKNPIPVTLLRKKEKGIYNVGTQNKHGDNAVDEDEKIKIKTPIMKNVTGKRSKKTLPLKIKTGL